MHEPKGPIAVADGPRHIGKTMQAHIDDNVYGQLQPKSETLGPSGERSTILYFYWEGGTRGLVVHVVALKPDRC